MKWFEENRDHPISFLEKQAIKLALGQAKTVGDLMDMALKLLKKG